MAATVKFPSNSCEWTIRSASPNAVRSPGSSLVTPATRSSATRPMFDSSPSGARATTSASSTSGAHLGFSGRTTEATGHCGPPTLHAGELLSAVPRRRHPGRRSRAGLTRVTKLRNRPAGTEDLVFLATMLGEAAVWRPDKPTPTAEEAMADPRYALYLAGWPRQGDYGLVAEQDGPVGAAWYRTYAEANHGHGFVAEDVPELSIAVIASRRHHGIGRRLLIDLIETSVAEGCRALSLSVAENNPARGLYESAGFVLVGKHGHSCTMVRPAAASN